MCTRLHSIRWLCCQHGCHASVLVIYQTCNLGDVGSNPIRGNMFFFQNLFHIYIYIYIFLVFFLFFEHAPLPKGGWCLHPTCFIFCKWYHPAVSQWKSRKCSYGWLPIHPIMNQNKLLSGPVSALLSSSVDFYSFSLSSRFRIVGLTAVSASLSTRLYTLPN